MGKKLLWKVLPVAFLAGVGSTAFTSCADEYDPAKITREDILKENYAKNWEEVFGTPDPNQDWSMAQPVTATINVPNANGGTLRIMSGSTLHRGYQILSETKMTGTDATVNFDVVKGTKDVFVEVTNANGFKLVNGYFSIENGKVNVSKLAASTRATSDATVSIYIDPQAIAPVLYTGVDEYNTANETTLTSDEYDALPDADKVKTPGTPDGSVAMTLVNGAMLPVPKTYKAGITEADKWYYDSTNDWDFFNTNFSNYIENMNEGQTSIPRFYKLSNVATSWSDDLKYEDYYPLVGTYVSTIDGTSKPGPFKETDNHVKAYFGKTAETSDLHLDKDASIVTKGGEVVITYMGGGTMCTNDIGYFYYKKSEESRFFTDGVFDINKVNKYVFCEDMANHTYMRGDYYGTPNTPLTGPTWQGAVNQTATDPAWKNAKYQGTDFKLTWFGDEGDGEITTSSTGDYDFPADYVIGFFGIRTDIGPAQGTFGQIDHFYTSFASVDLNYFNTLPHGATFKYKGDVFLGVEDNNDYDINDFLFMLQGVKEDLVPDVTPEDDPDVPVTQKWLVACEDLGGSLDYDFNDVVIGFEKKKVGTGDAAKDHLFLKPLAAGGTLPSVVGYEGYEGSGLKEIHQMLGAVPSDGNYTQIYSKFDADEIDLGELGSTSIAEAIRKLSITVTNAGSAYEITAWDKDGVTKTPQMILLPGGWDWPTEGTCITEVYSNFPTWSQDAKKTDWTKKTGAAFIENSWGADNDSSGSGEGGNQGGGSGSGEGGNQGGGSGSQITPSGTTTYSGDALEAIKSNGVFVVPAEACQTATACTVKLTFAPTDTGFVELNAWSTDSWGALFESPNWGQTYQLNGIESDVEYSYPVVSTQFENINKNGMSFSTNYGSITKIEIVAE